MPHKTPNYSQDRSQRERAQQAKAQKRSDLLTEKSAKRKEARGEVEPKSQAVSSENLISDFAAENKIGS